MLDYILPFITMTSPFIEFIWQTTLVLMILLFLGCYSAPKFMVRLQAMPWVFLPSWNVKLEFQSVLYAVFHTRWFSRLSHITFPIEQLAWFVLMFWVHPAFPLVAFALLSVQAVLIRERLFSLFLIAFWMLCVGVSYALFVYIDHTFLLWSSKVLLIAGGILRLIGHFVEPIPPMVQNDTDTFVPLSEFKFTGKTPFTIMFGYVSEFTSSLPFRLVIVQMYWLWQKLGLRPKKLSDWSKCCEYALSIQEKGWRGYSVTRELFSYVYEDENAQNMSGA